MKTFHYMLMAVLGLSLVFAGEPAKPKVKVVDLEPEAAAPEKWPAELKVVGKEIQTLDGKVVWLQGVNVISYEFSAKGEHVLKAADVAISEWKSNIIRLPVKDDYWFGRGKYQGKDGGADYRKRVEDTVTFIANRGAYVLFDLHQFRAPKPEHLEFWKEAAAKFKNHPAVIFDVFNEPHGISWEVWRDGGFVEEKKKAGEEDAFLTEEEKARNKKGFMSPGMQKMVDTIRETGAKNICVVGGLDYAYDLSGVANGFVIEDKTGNGIVYASHIYPWKRGWEKRVLPTAEKHPVLVGEIGCDIKKLSFLPASAQENPYTWAPDAMAFLQKYKLHYTAFSFHPAATPVMIEDWSFKPTPFWGEFVKKALAGEQFEMKKMR